MQSEQIINILHIGFIICLVLTSFICGAECFHFSFNLKYEMCLTLSREGRSERAFSRWKKKMQRQES